MNFNFNKKPKPIRDQQLGDKTLAELLSTTIAVTSGTPDGKPLSMKSTMKLAKYMHQLDENGQVEGDEEDAKEIEKFIENSAFAVIIKHQLFEVIDDARLEEKASSRDKN